MKRSSVLFLQLALVLIGIGVLILLLWEPHLEGRNVHATTFEIYFHDPFLAYVYIGSTPFFIALYRAFRLFGHAGQTGVFSQTTVHALRAIKHCAMAIIAFVAGGVIFIAVFGDKDDRPAGLFMALLVVLASTAVAAVTTTLAGRLQNSLSRSARGAE